MRSGTFAYSWIELLALLLPVAALAGEHTADEHAKHRAAMQSNKFTVAQETYAVPDIVLTDQNGADVRIRDILSSGRPVAVNFIFTTCTTICPVMTATMLQMQSQLADDSQVPDFISISIDPDYDTAEVMKSYAENFGANWTFLTGNHDDVVKVLQSFDAYRGSKINHFALTLMNAGDGASWTRVEGLTSAAELAQIWRKISS
jgi:protein SCO1/2